jgi:hypothetical protein
MDCSAFLSGRHGRWRRLDRPHGPVSEGVRVDVGARMRGMWR